MPGTPVVTVTDIPQRQYTQHMFSRVIRHTRKYPGCWNLWWQSFQGIILWVLWHVILSLRYIFMCHMTCKTIPMVDCHGDILSPLHQCSSRFEPFGTHNPLTCNFTAKCRTFRSIFLQYYKYPSAIFFKCWGSKLRGG